MYFPWVGRNYAKTRLLLLGESAYSWESPEDGELEHPGSDHSVDSVKWAIDAFPKAGRFFNMLTRGLTGKWDPSKEEVQKAWNLVAFTNYIDGTVGTGPRTRPSEEMWAAAKRAFLQDLKLLDPLPKRIIVIGLMNWAGMPQSAIHYSDTTQAYVVDGQRITCQAVLHPAGGLSAETLAGVIHFAHPDEFARVPDS